MKMRVQIVLGCLPVDKVGRFTEQKTLRDAGNDFRNPPPKNKPSQKYAGRDKKADFDGYSNHKDAAYKNDEGC